mgnify:CR=1 FL=1
MFELWHEMDVLEHDPVASNRSTLNQQLGVLFHTFTEGQEVELAHTDSYFLDQFLYFSLRISTWTQDKDDRSLFRRLLKHFLVDDGRRLDVEVVLHPLDDEALDRVDDTIWSEDPADEQKLELVVIGLLVVSTRQGCLFGTL